MLNIVQNIIVRMLLAIIPSIIWTILSYGIIYLKNNHLSEQFLKTFNALILANYIIIVLVLIFFVRDNLVLF